VRAIAITRPGGPEVLTQTSLPDPSPGPGEVLIAVAAAGVNPADLLQRRGRYPPPPGAPDTPGLEVSGTVVALGEGADRWRTGDRVAALVDGGGYAELVAVSAEQALPAPDGIDLVDLAALPEAACTAWSNLVTVGGLRAGRTALVHGGSGGVGTVAIQLGRALGATVLTTAGGPERVARCVELGAHVGVDHRREDFVAAVRRATGGRGADVVLDVVGAAYLERNLLALAPDGRLVVIGLQGGRRAEIDLGVMLARRASIHGTALRSRPPAQKAAIVADVAERVWPLLRTGALRPVVHARLPFTQAARAHELLESGEVFGKVLLVP
jgi:NADPH:quinone reductase